MGKQHLIKFLGVVLATSVLAACGGGAKLGGTSPGTTPPPGGVTPTGIPATLTIAAAQTSITGDGASTSLLTATLKDTVGVAIPSITLSFSTNAGTLSAASAATDANGNAITRLTSPKSLGLATITVREAASGLSANATVSFKAGPATTVSLTLAPTTIRPAGTTTANVAVTDANGLQVSGEFVTLGVTTNTSGGQFAATTVTTDANGRATTTYQAGPTAGTDTLQAALAASGAGAIMSKNLTVNASSATITAVKLTLGAATAVADGTTATSVSAAVTDSTNAPVPGSAVNFTTTAGTLSAPTATTNANGIATVNLNSPTVVGSATVTAATAGLSDNKQITFVAGNPKSIVLSAAPSTVAPSGTATVRATVFDGAGGTGNRVPNITVSFSLPAASVSNGGRFTSATVTTDANGEATTQYVAPGSGASDTITAQTTAGISNTAPITISTSGAVVTGLTVVTATTQVAAGSQVVVRATVQTNGSLTGVPVNFSTSAGTLSATSSTTDATGVAAVTLTAPNNLGAVQLTASTGNYAAQTQVQVIAGNPFGFVVTVASSPVAPGSTASITAQVTDQKNNPVVSQTVQFQITTSNTSQSSVTPATAVTDANGIVKATFLAGTTAQALAGTQETVTLTSGAATKAVPISISPTAKAVAGIVLTPASVSVAAGAVQSFVATVKDGGGQPLPGQTVNFSATAGSFSAPTTSDANGNSTVSFTAPTTAGTVTVTASSGGYSTSSSVTVQPGKASVVSLTLSPATVAAAHATSATAVVTDANNNAVPNHAVQFSATAGTGQFSNGTSNISATTDANGLATVSYVPTASATITATATPENISTGKVVTVSATAVPVGALNVTALTTSLPADGASKATVRATVTDASSKPLQGISVHFNATAGTPTSADITTDTNGFADFVLTAPTVTGSATVTASTGGFSNSATVTFVPGAPSKVTLTVNPVTVNTNSSTTLTAVVVDAQGNPLPSATVNFSVTVNGSNSTVTAFSATTDARGVAVAPYTAGNTVGQDKLNATVAGVSPANSGSATLVVTNPVKAVSLIASSPQLASGAKTTAQGLTITALVKDNNNNVLPGVQVKFASAKAAGSVCGQGGAVVVTNSTTDANGTASAVLTTGGDQDNQTIAVTATAGGVPSPNINIPVTGTHLTVTGPATVGSGDTATYTITLLDSNNSPIVNKTVTVTSALGNPLSSPSFVTDVSGSVVVTYTGTTGGSETLTASASCATTQNLFTVSSMKLVFNSPAANSEVKFDVSTPVKVTLTQNGSPLSGQKIVFASTRGTLTAPAVTDVNGQTTVNFTATSSSPGANGAGGAVISATGPGGVSASVPIEVVATTPSTVTLQASPNTLPINGTSVIQAVVRDAKNNLVKNQRVNFQLSDITGGKLSAAFGITDSQGSTAVTYTATSTASSKDGVQVAGKVVDSNSGATLVSSVTVSLTVGGAALRIVLGTGNLVDGSSSTVYVLPYSIIVTDASGNPPPNDTTFRLIFESLAYQKGYFVFDTTANRWVQILTVTGAAVQDNGVTPGAAPFGCRNEDINRNGILDNGEDYNNNGVLDPGNVATVPNTVALNNGVGSFSITYPKDRAFWVQGRLTGIASTAGTESREIVSFVLPGAGKDYSDKAVAPPGQPSPYGVATTCATMDDVAFIQISTPSATVATPNGSFPVTVSLTQAPKAGKDVQVRYTISGTGAANVTSGLSGTLIFKWNDPNPKSQTITVTYAGASKNQTMTVTLDNDPATLMNASLIAGNQSVTVTNQ